MARKLLIALGALLAIVLLVGFVLPNDVTVTRSATINAPPDRVYPLVATPRQWPQWSPWNSRDPKMAISYAGPESGTGASWSWISKSEGDGAMKLMDGQPPTAISFELTVAGMGPPSHGHFEIAPAGGGTTVTWTMTATMGFGPLGGWFALYVPTMITKDFDAGLAGLKRLAELPVAPEPTPPPAAGAAVQGAGTVGVPGALGAAPEPLPRTKP